MSENHIDYCLGNAETLQAEHPDDLAIPSRDERAAVAPAQLVTLLFEIVEPHEGMPPAERMWVAVTQEKEGRYQGRLQSEPAHITTVHAGETVEFGPEHVVSVMSDVPLSEKKVIVSRRSLDQALRPGWVCRQDPVNPEDSGWMALVGDESDEELDDPASALIHPAGELMQRWPELESLLQGEQGEQPGSTWVWDESSGAYVQEG